VVDLFKLKGFSNSFVVRSLIHYHSTYHTSSSQILHLHFFLM